MVNDLQLSRHFTLYQLTATSHTDLQEQNRMVSPRDVDKLKLVAALLEDAWDIIGPFDISDAYRCPALNSADGGVADSQHERAEAADMVPWGGNVLITGTAFDKLVKAARAKYFKFGQLIFEPLSGTTGCIHISLGAPYRLPAKCGQILKKVGNGKYENVEDQNV